jgi:hypothetical protein
VYVNKFYDDGSKSYQHEFNDHSPVVTDYIYESGADYSWVCFNYYSSVNYNNLAWFTGITSGSGSMNTDSLSESKFTDPVGYKMRAKFGVFDTTNFELYGCFDS